MTGKDFIGVTVIGSPSGKCRHARHAHQLRPAVDLGAARAASPGLAVPAHGEGRLLLGLDVVDGVEDDHPRIRLDLVVVELAAFVVSAKDAELRVPHFASFTPSPRALS